MLDLLVVPFLACLVLTGIHVYLGLHVLARGVIFVDLALAQIAALGISVAGLAGHPIQSDAAAWYALAFTVAGAALFALSRLHAAPVPQEAIIGIVYAVSAAVAVLVVDRAPQGSEYIKQLLVGSILTVSPGDVTTIAIVYGVLGVVHWLMRRPLLEISFDAVGARARGRAVAAWDFAFYTSFGLVVTSSVRLAGVLLVFSYLIVPAVGGALLARNVVRRLLVGWTLGVAVSVVGLLAAWTWDLPTGAAIVATFGVALALVAIGLGVVALGRRVREHGVRALTGVVIGVGVVVALAGSLLIAVPMMDHPWLAALERALPAAELLFLDRDERAEYAESRQDVVEGEAELARMRQLRDDVQWGRRPMSPDMQERLRQYIAGRAELVTGERLVLQALRRKARERQRYGLGVPLVLCGTGVIGAAVWLGRRA